MPTQIALEREDAVLDLLCERLTDADRRISVAERPDRQPPHVRKLDVDAILRVQQHGREQLWAADVCTVAVPAAMPAAVEDLRQNVLPGLEEIAEAGGRAFTFGCTPRLFAEDVTAKGRKTQLKKDAKAILDAAVVALNAGQDHLPEPDDDLQIQILLSEGATHSDGSRVQLVLGMTGNDAAIANQLARDLAPTLRAKLRKQLKYPRSAGYPVVLVLDQRGHAGMPVPTNFVASPSGIRSVVEQYVSDEHATLDACVLVDANNDVIELIGRVGNPLSDSAS